MLRLALGTILCFAVSCSAEHSSAETAIPEVSQTEDQMIVIQIGDRKFEAELNNSKGAENFLQELPLKVTMQDLSHNEKYYQFSNRITTESPKPYPQIQCGDIMIYSGRYIVLFYQTFTQDTYQYVKVGSVVDTNDLADVVGTGSVEITWKVE